MPKIGEQYILVGQVARFPLHPRDQYSLRTPFLDLCRLEPNT